MGHDTDEFRASATDLPKAEIMVAGAQKKIVDLLTKNEIDGAVALGGASMALIGQGYEYATLGTQGNSYLCSYAGICFRMVRLYSGCRCDAGNYEFTGLNDL